VEEKKIQRFQGYFLSRLLFRLAEGFGGEMTGCPLLMVI